jgi:hypothetical protein
MPTPFYHLSFARDLADLGALPAVLREAWPAFCLGNIAPDAQTLTGAPRTTTHFFDVPMHDLTPAWQTMFSRHPDLADPACLAPDRAAFLAGYICHLALDQLWIAEIFDPIFGEAATWSSFQRRLFLHNVLRVHLDRIDLPGLQAGPGAGATLKQARPEAWLPFLPDPLLGRWRDFVADQLADGAAAQTVEVFAARMNLAPAEFESLLKSPAAMQEQIFDRLPAASLAGFRTRGLAHCQAVLSGYLEGRQA